MISKADDNSTKMETENCLLDLAILRFLGTLKIVTSMEWVYVEASLEGVQQKMGRMKLETVTLNRLFALFPLNSAWKWIIMKWRGHFFFFLLQNLHSVYIWTKGYVRRLHLRFFYIGLPWGGCIIIDGWVYSPLLHLQLFSPGSSKIPLPP